MLDITIGEGKYRFVQEDSGRVHCYRGGEYWEAGKDLMFSKAFVAALYEIEELRKRDAFLSALEGAGVDNWGGYEEAQRAISDEQ